MDPQAAAAESGGGSTLASPPVSSENGPEIVVPAGGEAACAVDYFNAAPEAAEFHARLEGLHVAWVRGAGPALRQVIASGSGGSVAVTLAPPEHAHPGRYPFRIAVCDDRDDVVEAASFVLTVTPRPASTVMPRLAAPAAIDPGPSSLALPAPPIGGSGRTDLMRVPEPTLSSPATAPDPQAEVVRPEPPAAAPPVPDPFAPGEAVQFAGDLSKAAPAPRVDAEDAEGAPEADTPETPVEPTLADPREGCEIRLYPGDRLLVSLSVRNAARHVRTYVLDEDGSLDDDWINLVQDQASLERGSEDALTLRLHPPLGAPPGRYPFSISYGPEGAPLTRRTLVLVVLGVPLVKLECAEAEQHLGPFPRSEAVFRLKASNLGNLDCAVRLYLDDFADGHPCDDLDTAASVIRTAHSAIWFDREVGSVHAPTQPGAPGVGDEFCVHVRRTSPWWFGLRETVKVTAVAVPVTNPSNQLPNASVDAAANRVDLTLTRSRWSPVCNTLVACFLSLFIIVGLSAVRDIRFQLDSPQYSDASDATDATESFIDTDAAPRGWTQYTRDAVVDPQAPASIAPRRLLNKWVFKDTDNRFWIGVPLPAGAAHSGVEAAGLPSQSALVDLLFNWKSGPLYPVRWLVNRSDTGESDDGQGYLLNRSDLTLRLHYGVPESLTAPQPLVIGDDPAIVDIKGDTQQHVASGTIERTMEVDVEFGSPVAPRRSYLWFIYFRQSERLELVRLNRSGRRGTRLPPGSTTDQLHVYDLEVGRGAGTTLRLRNLATGRDTNYWLVKNLGNSSPFRLGYLNEAGSLSPGEKRDLVFERRTDIAQATSPSADNVKRLETTPAATGSTETATEADSVSPLDDPNCLILATSDPEYGIFAVRLRQATEKKR